jgi:hypothetical protein
MYHRMQHSASHYAAFLLALGAGACHGKLAVLNDPPLDSPTEVDGISSTQPGANSASNSNAPLAQCSRLDRDMAAWEASILPAPPVQCGACDCEESDAACQEQACPTPFVLPRCKENTYDQPDNALVRGFEITGYNLNLELEGYGGCGQTDFVLCYIPPDASTAASQAGYPKTATIKLENPTSPAECGSITFQNFDIDLRTLGEFKAAEGNLVNTRFGTVGLGEQNCQDQATLAASHYDSLYQASYQWDRSCETDADCEVVFIEPSCAGPRCSPEVSSHAGIAALRARAAAVDADVCGGFADKCAGLFDQPGSTPPLFDVPGCEEPTSPARCYKGQCR